MKISQILIMLAAMGTLLSTGGMYSSQAAEKSRYMGGEATIVEAPNGALVNAEVLETGPKISYLEPTTEKVANGVWCIGGVSLANTTVI